MITDDETQKLNQYRLEILKGLISNNALSARHSREELINIADEMAHMLISFESREGSK